MAEYKLFEPLSNKAKKKIMDKKKKKPAEKDEKVEKDKKVKNYEGGGYVLSAEDKRRRKAFKSGAGKGRNNTGMKKIKMNEGGMLKAVPEDKKKSLGKLPTPVREKMGFMKEGGSTNKEINAMQSIGAAALKGAKSYKKRQEDISKKMDAQYKSDVKKFKDDKKGLKEGGMIIVDRNYLKGK
jgi:hypothetical protein